jgi:two-component system response regulator FixJ
MVYVIDQDLETRRCLTAHLGIVGVEAWPFGSAGEFLDILGHLMPACILLDMDMPQMRGLDFMDELRRRGIDWPVVAMSARDELLLAVEAMKRGAVDFLQKPVGESTLVTALTPALRALDRLVEAGESRRAAQERIGRLTPREIDIALALLSGRANKTVAHDLGISVRTVEMHRAHIMAKLGIKSLAEAAVIATQAGLELSCATLAPALPTRPLPRLAASSAPPPFLLRGMARRSAV